MTSTSSLSNLASPGVGPTTSTLLVTNLSPKVTQEVLSAIFSIAGPLVSTTILPSTKDSLGRSPSPTTLSGLVTFVDPQHAESAIQALQNRAIFGQSITISRIAQDHAVPANLGPVSSSGVHRVSTQRSSSFQQSATTTSSPPTSSEIRDSFCSLPCDERETHVFVGNLSQDVDEGVLLRVFSSFRSLKEARIIRDPVRARNRGFGFLTFRDKADAERCISTMNGEKLFDRPIKVNYASSPKAATISLAPPTGFGLGMPIKVNLGMPPTGGSLTGTPITYEQALAGSTEDNTTIYVGNLVPYCGADDLATTFSSFGKVHEVRLQSHKGFAFVRLDSHEHAAAAITALAGAPIHGRPMKLGWAKNRIEALLRHWPTVPLQQPLATAAAALNAAGLAAATRQPNGLANFDLSAYSYALYPQHQALLAGLSPTALPPGVGGHASAASFPPAPSTAPHVMGPAPGAPAPSMVGQQPLSSVWPMAVSTGLTMPFGGAESLGDHGAAFYGLGPATVGARKAPEHR